MKVAENVLKPVVPRPRLPLPLWVFAGSAALYFAIPAARFNFDGVACAIAVELGELPRLAHGNHLAYGVLGWLFFRVLQLFGYTGPALLALQVFSSLLSAGAAAAFSSAALRAGLPRAVAAAAAAGLAVSGFYWAWALEAQVYPLGAVFLFLAAREALAPKPDARRLGLLHAGAMLGHAGHMMFVAAALTSLPDRRARVRYLWTAAAAVVAAYAFAAVAFVRPSGLDGWRVWLLGSGALTVDKSFLWHGGYSPHGFGQWLGNTVGMLGAGPLAGLAAWLMAAWVAARSWSQSKPVRLAVYWLCAYAVLFIAWEPATPVYRVTDLGALWLLLGIAFSRLPLERLWSEVSPARLAKLRAGAAAALVAWLGLWNLATQALPNSDPARNAALQRSLWLKRETPESAWILVDHIDQVYVPYFAQRKPLNLRYHDAASLGARLDELGRLGQSVYAVPETLSEPWRIFLSGRRMEPRGVSGGETLILIH